MTPSSRRTAIRSSLKNIITNSLNQLPHCKVFTARGESEGLEDFVCVYFDEGERIQKHSLVDSEAELVIRINTKADPRLADDRLDEISGYIETAIDGANVDSSVFEMFNSGFRYSDSPSGNYSAVELIYRIQYSDS